MKILVVVAAVTRQVQQLTLLARTHLIAQTTHYFL